MYEEFPPQNPSLALLSSSRAVNAKRDKDCSATPSHVPRLLPCQAEVARQRDARRLDALQVDIKDWW